MEEYKFGDFVSGARHSKNFTISVHNRPATDFPILVTRTYAAPTIADVVETTEDGTEETTETFVATPEPDDITTERENCNEEYTITEETDTGINENSHLLPVENNISVQVC